MVSAGGTVHKHLASYQRIERDVQQEHKSKRQDRGFEAGAHLTQVRPEERFAGLAEEFFRRKVEEHGAEERLGYSHAAENEILPCRLDRRRRTVERDEKDRGQRGQFHRYPEHTDVIGKQAQEHGKDEELKHGMVEAHASVADMAVLPLPPHVFSAEDGRRHGNKGGKDREVDIEGIDEEELIAGNHGPPHIDLEGQPDPRRAGESRADDIYLGRKLPVADEGKDKSSKEGHA